VTTLFTAPQPAPTATNNPALWPLIIAEVSVNRDEISRLLVHDMRARHEFGVAKYGKPLTTGNGRDHVADAFQEYLDGLVYVRAALEEERAKNATRTEVIQSLEALCADTLDMCMRTRAMLAARS